MQKILVDYRRFSFSPSFFNTGWRYSEGFREFFFFHSIHQFLRLFCTFYTCFVPKVVQVKVHSSCLYFYIWKLWDGIYPFLRGHLNLKLTWSILRKKYISTYMHISSYMVYCVLVWLICFFFFLVNINLLKQLSFQVTFYFSFS